MRDEKNDVDDELPPRVLCTFVFAAERDTKEFRPDKDSTVKDMLDCMNYEWRNCTVVTKITSTNVQKSGVSRTWNSDQITESDDIEFLLYRSAGTRFFHFMQVIEIHLDLIQQPLNVCQRFCS